MNLHGSLFLIELCKSISVSTSICHRAINNKNYNEVQKMASFTSNIKVTDFTIKSNEPMYSNQALSGQRIVRSTGIQYYQIQFQLNWNIKDLGEVNNFLAQYSQGKSFTMSLGSMGTYRGTQTGSLTASAQANKGASVINTSTNKLAVGELIQFTNHKKIYRIIARTGTSITVFPNLQNVVQSSELIIYDNLMITAQLDPDNDYSLPVGQLMSIKLKATEVI